MHKYTQGADTHRVVKPPIRNEVYLPFELPEGRIPLSTFHVWLEKILPFPFLYLIKTFFSSPRKIEIWRRFMGYLTPLISSYVASIFMDHTNKSIKRGPKIRCPCTSLTYSSTPLRYLLIVIYGSYKIKMNELALFENLV